jgi:hypothetical protein
MPWCCGSSSSRRSRRSTGQPGLPINKGCARTVTHDYKRHSITTLFAALNILDGTVIGQNMQRDRQKELNRFLNRVERATQRTRTFK